MWNYIFTLFRKGIHIMTDFILAVKKTLQNTSSPITIFPSTNYRRHAPQSAAQLMGDNWRKTGDSLGCAMKKVGAEIEKQ